MAIIALIFFCFFSFIKERKEEPFREAIA